MRIALGALLIVTAILVATITYSRYASNGAPAGPVIFLSASSALVGTDTVDLLEVGFSRGDPAAPITVLEFSDFGCPFCAMFARGTYPELSEEFVQTGRVRWILVPFASGRFRNGESALRAAFCAAEQERFFPMKERLYATQREWMGERRPDGLFRAYAMEAGSEEPRFTSCLRGDSSARHVAAATRATDLLRIHATPTFIIGDSRLEGSLPATRFRQLILAAEDQVQ